MNYWQSYLSSHKAEILKAFTLLESFFDPETFPAIIPIDPHAAEVAKSCVQVVHEDRFGASRLFEEDIIAHSLTMGECRETVKEARTYFLLWGAPCK